MSQDAILGYLYLSIDYSRFAAATQDLRPGTFSVVPYGTSRASLLNPGLTSWATLSRPSGTQFGERSSHSDTLAPEVFLSCPVRTFSATC
jgi:hypothetical protein